MLAQRLIVGGRAHEGSKGSITETGKIRYFCVVARLLSPHADPLPQGEGKATPDSRKFPPRLSRRPPGDDSPSPQGRGPGCTGIELSITCYQSIIYLVLFRHFPH